MIIKRKLFANITNTTKLLRQKIGFTDNIKSATGLANKKIAKNSKQLATEMSNFTGDASNSFVLNNKNHQGVVSYTYPKKGIRKSKSEATQLELFPEFPKSKPSTISKKSFKNKFNNTKYEDITDVNEKRRWLKEFGSHKTRGKLVNQASGQEEIDKIVKTNGMSMNQRVGLVLPGFNKV